MGGVRIRVGHMLNQILPLLPALTHHLTGSRFCLTASAISWYVAPPARSSAVRSRTTLTNDDTQ